MTAVGHGFECTFEDTYICGYTMEGLELVWTWVKAWNVNDGIGPTSDHTGSVRGKVDIMIEN